MAAYLGEWLDAHAMEIKPRTLADYRACIRLYAVPRIGHMPIEAVRPSTITRLYRDLLTGGGRDGKPLAVATVTHLHAVPRKAFRDAVIVDELIGSNPGGPAKRPRTQAQEAPAPCGPSRSSARSWRLRSSIDCSRSSTSPRTPGHVAASCDDLRITRGLLPSLP